MNCKRVEMQDRKSPSNNLSIQVSISHLLPVKTDINNIAPWRSRIIDKRVRSEKKQKRYARRQKVVVVPLMSPTAS